MSGVIDGRLGKYAVVGTLGRGAMGTVYDGRDPIIDRRVAIKTIPLVNAGEDSEAADELARFKREAQAAGRLQHPNIVGVYDYGETETLAYIVMEFVDGTSLKAVLDRGERMAPAEAARVMTQLLAGLQYSHERGVVHRDIKPANIIINTAGVVKIADFGIARIESSSLTQAGTIMGTPAYMSPEQFMGQTVDARTDIYSSGVLLYQLLTGERPFEGSMTAIMHKALNTTPPRPSEISVTAPPGLDAVVATAMAKRPEDRFATAAAFAQALAEGMTAPRPVAPPPPEEDAEATMVAPVRRDAADATRVQAPPPAPPVIPPASRGRSKAPLLAGVAVVALLAAGGIGYVATRSGASPKGTTISSQPAAKPPVTEAAPPSEPSSTPPPQMAGATPHTAASVPPPEQTSQSAPPVPTGAPTTSPAKPPTDSVAPIGTAAVIAAPKSPDVTAPGKPTAEASAGDLPAAAPKQPAAPASGSEAAPVSPPTGSSTPAAPPSAAPSPSQQAAASTPDALRAAIKQAIAPIGCSLLGGDVSGGALRLDGVVSDGSAPLLQSAIAEDAPGTPTDLQVARFTGPYCGLLDVLRPVAARFGAKPEALQLGLKSGDGALRKDDYLIPRITMPDWPAYLTVDYFQSDGTLAHLFPADAAQRGRRFPPHTTVNLGDPAAGESGWKVDVPFGTDMMVAIASAKPLFTAARPDDDSPDKYLPALKAALHAAQSHGGHIDAAVSVVRTVAK